MIHIQYLILNLLESDFQYIQYIIFITLFSIILIIIIL